MTDPAAILRRETLVSAVINGALSAAFFLLVFGPAGPVRVRGLGAYAFDFVPQSLAIGIMAALVPALLVRRAMRRGDATSRVPSIRVVLLRPLGHGLAAMAIGGGACAALLWITGVQQLPELPALVTKVLYGAILGAIITRQAVIRILTDARKSKIS